MLDLSPVVESYSITVSISMEAYIPFLKYMSLAEAENSLKQIRTCESNPIKRIELDRAIALLQYAGSSGASLKEMIYKELRLFVTFSFDSLDDLIKFRNLMHSAVSEVI